MTLRTIALGDENMGTAEIDGWKAGDRVEYPGEYIRCAKHEVPSDVTFHVPPSNQGQFIEVAYGGFGKAEHGNGDPYKRVTDRSIARPDGVAYYRLTALSDDAAWDHVRSLLARRGLRLVDDGAGYEVCPAKLYRIETVTGRGMPTTVDADGYDTEYAARQMAQADHDGEFRIVAYDAE